MSEDIPEEISQKTRGGATEAATTTVSETASTPKKASVSSEQPSETALIAVKAAPTG